MNVENCFDKCAEWKSLDAQLDNDLDAVYEQIAVVSRKEAERLQRVAISNTTTPQQGVSIIAAQNKARNTISELMMDRDDAEAVVASCEQSACAAAQFCTSRLVTQEAAS